MRLINGSGTQRFAGKVEVCLNGRWGSVCIREWDAQDAEVVCRQIAQQLGVDIVRESLRRM